MTWGNWEYITLEICRILLCIQIVAVAVELPKKYMKKHWVSVAILLLPVMTFGWLVVGLFIWCLIPHFSFLSALLVSACVTATDPVLAAAVVGKGKFAERVPGHLRNLLSAESGCNDGMAFPFIFLSLNLLLHPGNAGEIVKDWILVTILYECIFGCILGVVIGFVMKRAVAFAEKKKLIDRESFLAIFVFIAFNSAGIGSMLGVDDLLVSFAAGTAFGWNGDFAKKTEESHVSTVIDLLLNLAFFVYFGAIIPWPDFNNAALGLNCWRLIILAIVIIFLRRMPAVMAFQRFTPDIKSWREALFCGHFGPIGVGAIFAVILAKKELEGYYTTEETPLVELPSNNFPHYQLLQTLWPIVCFIILTSIIVHGSSVAVLTLGKRLNRMAITMSFTATNTRDQGPTWMSRLQKLEKASTSFSLHRIDSNNQELNKDEMEKDDLGIQLPSGELSGDGGVEGLGPRTPTIETSGIKVRPAGGAKRRKHKKKRRQTPSDLLKKSLSRNEDYNDELKDDERKPRPQTEFLQLGRTRPITEESGVDIEKDDQGTIGGNGGGVPGKESSGDSELSSGSIELHKLHDKDNKLEINLPLGGEEDEINGKEGVSKDSGEATTAYKEGDMIVIEDQHGEVVETVSLKSKEDKSPQAELDDMSIHSEASLRRQLSNYSQVSESEASSAVSPTASKHHSLKKHASRALYRRDDPKHRKVYAHQVDNMIVIENEEGEIIRRYRVNRHGSQGGESSEINGAGTGSGSGTGRARSSSIVGKALSWMGRNKDEEGSTGVGTSTNNRGSSSGPTVPSINVILSASSQSSKDNTPLKDARAANTLELKITKILKGNENSDLLSIIPIGKNSKNKRRPSVVPEASEGSEDDSEISQDSEEFDNTEESGTDDDDDIHETSVERRRRLAALGKVPGHRRDDDEEE